MCEIGRWLGEPGDIVYEDKFGNVTIGPVAMVTASREREEYDACIAREHARQRETYSLELNSLADAPVANDALLEQPTRFDPIGQEDYWISNSRTYYRPWMGGPFWLAHDWREIPKSANRVGIVQERMWRVAFQRRSGGKELIWTKPLRSYELSSSERRLADQGGERQGLDPSLAATCPWGGVTGSFSRNRADWFDPLSRKFVHVWWQLKKVGVSAGSFWRVVYHDVGPDGRTVSILSLPLNWADLSRGERASFEQRPSDMNAFDRR